MCNILSRKIKAKNGKFKQNLALFALLCTFGQNPANFVKNGPLIVHTFWPKIVDFAKKSPFLAKNKHGSGSYCTLVKMSLL